MKTVLKITILLLAVTLAIGGVMWYAKTRVSPPVALKPVNQYVKDLDSLTNELAKVESAAGEDNVFGKAVSRVEIFQKEGKLEAADADGVLDKVVQGYAPKFLQRCFDKFAHPVWSEADHQYMLSRIALLKEVKHSDQSSALQKSAVDSMNTVSRVISDYRDARRISQSSGFSGLAQAKATISKARAYAAAPYLSNCRDLVSALGTVRGRIGSSHYHYVVGRVNELANYYYYSSDYYVNTLIPSVDHALNEYKHNAISVYGSIQDIRSLEIRAKGYVDSFYGM